MRSLSARMETTLRRARAASDQQRDHARDDEGREQAFSEPEGHGPRDLLRPIRVQTLQAADHATQQPDYDRLQEHGDVRFGPDGSQGGPRELAGRELDDLK